MWALNTSVLVLIMHLEIHCHFNVVTLFSPYCIEEINTWSGAISMHVHTETHTNSPPRTHRMTHTEKWHVDQPNLMRKIQHVLQLWDSYWFLVHHLIDFVFLRVQIDGNSRVFLMGLNPDVCHAVSKGLSVLCALITHTCLSPAAPRLVDLYRGLQRDKEKNFSKSQRPIISQGELQAWIMHECECMIWFHLIQWNIQCCSLSKHHQKWSCIKLVLWSCSCNFRDFSPKYNNCDNIISEYSSFCLGNLFWDSREDVVDADDTVRSWGSAVVDDCGVTLDPDPATMLGQETIILSGDLTFYQHWRR